MNERPIISPDGRYVASGGMISGWGVLRVVDLKTREQVRFGSDRTLEFVTGYDWRKTGDVILVGMRAGDGANGKGPGGLWLWDVGRRTITVWLKRGEGIGEIVVSPDGRTIVIEDRPDAGHGKLSLLSSKGKDLGMLRASLDFSQVEWLPDSRSIVCVDTSGKSIVVWDTSSDRSRIVARNATSPSVCPR
jgi:WD40 repeat protein